MSVYLSNEGGNIRMLRENGDIIIFTDKEVDLLHNELKFLQKLSKLKKLKKDCKCSYCHRDLTIDFKYNKDHVVPRSLNGKETVIVCLDCNKLKKNWRGSLLRYSHKRAPSDQVTKEKPILNRIDKIFAEPDIGKTECIRLKQEQKRP